MQIQPPKAKHFKKNSNRFNRTSATIKKIDVHLKNADKKIKKIIVPYTAVKKKPLLPFDSFRSEPPHIFF